MPRISAAVTDKWLALVLEFRATNLPLHKFAIERSVSPHSLNYLKRRNFHGQEKPCAVKSGLLQMISEIFSRVSTFGNGAHTRLRGNNHTLEAPQKST